MTDEEALIAGINARAVDHEYEGRVGWTVEVRLVDEAGDGYSTGGNYAATLAEFTGYGETAEEALRMLARNARLPR